MKKYTTLSSVQLDLMSNETSCSALVSYYLKQIDDNKHLNAFLEVFTDEAIKAAQLIDEKVKAKTAGK